MPPEVWLRGAIEGIAPLLQPAAHSLVQVREELERRLPSLDAAQTAATPGGSASIAYHVQHLAGSIDRLLTYARGEPLDEEQVARLQSEGSRRPADGASLLAEAGTAIDRAMAELGNWSRRENLLLEGRSVGRAQLPSTVLGLLFHAAEHAQRHAGQVATLARIVQVRAPG